MPAQMLQWERRRAGAHWQNQVWTPGQYHFQPLSHLPDIHNVVAELMDIHVNIHSHGLHIITGHVASEIVYKFLRWERIIADRRFIDDLNAIGLEIVVNLQDHILPIHLFEKLCLLITI